MGGRGTESEAEQRGALSFEMPFDGIGLFCLHLPRNGSQKIAGRCSDQTLSRLAQTSSGVLRSPLAREIQS